MELAGAARALPRFRKKSAAVLQPDLRRNATRCKHIIAESGENYKRKFQETFKKQFADKRKGQEKHRGSAAGSFEFSAFFVKGKADVLCREERTRFMHGRRVANRENAGAEMRPRQTAQEKKDPRCRCRHNGTGISFCCNAFCSRRAASPDGASKRCAALRPRRVFAAFRAFRRG